MPTLAAIAAMTLSTALCAWGARRDLQAPAWLIVAAFAVAAAATSLSVGPAYAPVALLTLVCGLIVEADRRHHLIPDLFTLSMLLLSFAMPFGDDLTTRAIGAVALGSTFLIIRQGFSMWRGSDALGLGDVKLAAAMGAVLGPIYGFAAVAIAGAATVLVVALRARGGTIALGAPFGVGLGAATAITALVRVIAS